MVETKDEDIVLYTNPWFNFMRDFRTKHGTGSLIQDCQNVSIEWSTISDEIKSTYYQQAEYAKLQE